MAKHSIEKEKKTRAQKHTSSSNRVRTRTKINTATKTTTKKNASSPQETSKKILTAIIVVIALVICAACGYYVYQNREELQDYISSIFEGETTPNITNIQNDTSKDGKRLVLKSLTEEGKVIEYEFRNNKVVSVHMKEQLKDQKQFEAKLKGYEEMDGVEVIETNSEELTILINRKDLGSDKDLSYDQVYEKYVVQMIGRYEKI